MDFIISSNALLNQISIANKIVGKTNLAILDNLKFEVKDSNLTITASDLESTLTLEVPVVEHNGECVIAVNATQIAEVLKNEVEQPLRIEINEDEYSLKIYTNTGEYNFPFVDGMDFPQKPSIKEDIKTTIEMPLDLFINSLNITLFAAAKDEMRPIMNGVNFAFKPEGIAVAATDGQRLAVYRNSSIINENEVSFVLPKKPAEILKQILVAKTDSVVELTFDDKNAMFTYENIVYVCRFLEGNFPNYQQIIPKDNPHKIVIDRDTFLKSVRKISSVASRGQQLISFNFFENKVLLVGKDIDYATSGKDEIPCQYEGDKIRIGFKASVIEDMLKVMYSQNVQLELSDPSRAGLIVPYENENIEEEIIMLAMPLMINDDEN